MTVQEMQKLNLPCLPLCIWEVAIAAVKLMSGVHALKPFFLMNPVHRGEV